jgi:hypothetical protein
VSGKAPVIGNVDIKNFISFGHKGHQNSPAICFFLKKNPLSDNFKLHQRFPGNIADYSTPDLHISQRKQQIINPHFAIFG